MGGRGRARPRPAVFDALAEAIAVLRGDAGGPDARDAVREAYMRRVLRRTVRDGFERIAVVCGAWHVPGAPRPAARRRRRPPAARPAEGQGHADLGAVDLRAAGLHLGLRRRHPLPRLVRPPVLLPGPADRAVAGPGRQRCCASEGIPVSSAHVIESVRLAEALAALRGRPLAGLEEVTEAARAVLCEGSDLLTGLIQRRMVVGERLGAVPAATPMVPLQRDLQAQQRHLRLRPEAVPRDYDLDLRKPNDLARSRLLHRLALLEVTWGTPAGGPCQEHRDVPGELAADLAARTRPGPDRGEHVGQHGGGRRRAAGAVRRRRGDRPRRAHRADRAVPARRPGRRPAGRCSRRSGTAPRWRAT